MDTPASREPGAVRISVACDEADYVAGRDLVEAYAAALNVDLCFQSFDEELRQFGQTYGPPHGCLLLARLGSDPIGCVAVRQHEGTTGELKRLYVKPAWRGKHAGRALAEAALVQARRLGYRELVLDTLESMTEAQALYAALGFRETAAYYRNPLPGARYMRLVL